MVAYCSVDDYALSVSLMVTMKEIINTEVRVVHLRGSNQLVCEALSLGLLLSRRGDSLTSHALMSTRRAVACSVALSLKARRPG